MKKYKNLYSQILNHSNLYTAWRKARRGKRYAPNVSVFESKLGEELLALHEELKSELYQPGKYRSFTVHEPKRRKISAAPFRDRVVHHAIHQVLEPIWEKHFIHDTYANRKGKGSHAALDRCTGYLRQFRYVLQCDIRQFFPSIDHAVLKDEIALVIADALTLRLCEKIIDSGANILTQEYTMYWFPGDDLLAAVRPRGLPIGNLTSQFWANVYLNRFDHFVKRTLKCNAYIRYVDDFLLFADDLVTLHLWRLKIIEKLQSLRLTLHENRAQISPCRSGIPFLGFVVSPNYRRLKYRKALDARRRLHSKYSLYRAGLLTRAQLTDAVLGWVGHAKHGDTWGLRTDIFSSMRLE